MPLARESGKICEKGVQDMDKKKDRLSISMEYNEMQTVPLALHEMHMARLNRLLRWLCVAWAASIIIAAMRAARNCPAFTALWILRGMWSAPTWSRRTLSVSWRS